MFRIVEDDMPPIPEEASEMLKDFLEQCFNKDPACRPNAMMLCEHPWLKQSWKVRRFLSCLNPAVSKILIPVY